MYAFKNCNGLANITIPESVKGVGMYAFENCSGLISVTISNSVTSVGDYAFNGCKNLTSIEFNGTIEQWNAMSKGAKWDYNTGNYTIHCTDGDIEK